MKPERKNPAQRVVITHHHLLSLGGSERVLEVFAEMYPEADVATLLADKRCVPKKLQGRRIITSFLQGIPGSKRMYRQLLPFYPMAVEALDLSGYGLVISADGAPTKGVITDQGALHLCYCHSPSRSLWDQHAEQRRGMSMLERAVFAPVSQHLRQWDFAAAQRPDGFVANSHYVAERTAKYYRRESTVIYPPVDTSMGYLSGAPSVAYLSVGRLVVGKRTDLLIGACNRLGRKLQIVGSGPEERALRRRAGPTIEFLGQVDDQELRRKYATCRALLFAADEDFGLVSIEAQAYGRPVIAYGRGGSLETVIGLDEGPPSQELPGTARSSNQHGPTGPTGVFFSEQTEDSLAGAMLRFEAAERRFEPERIQRHARNFDTQVFIDRFRNYVEEQSEKKRRGSALRTH